MSNILHKACLKERCFIKAAYNDELVHLLTLVLLTCLRDNVHVCMRYVPSYLSVCLPNAVEVGE